jgi:hypothetical protein
MFHKTFYGRNKSHSVVSYCLCYFLSLLLSLTNTQAFYVSNLIMALKCFMMQAPLLPHIDKMIIIFTCSSTAIFSKNSFTFSGLLVCAQS